MKASLYTTIIWPLAQVDNTVIILISSPKDRNHHVSQLMTKTNPADGSYLFTLCSVSEICADCLRHNRSEKECMHQIATVPDHLSSTNASALAALYDDKDMGQQELKGDPVLNEELLFKEFLGPFQNQERYIFDTEVQIIYSFFDPSGGGSSNATLVSHAPGLDGCRVIVAMDSCPRNETNEGTLVKKNMILRHFGHLYHRYPYAWFFVAIEANMSPDLANDVARDVLEAFPRRLTVTRRQVKQPTWYGVITTNEEKRKWSNYTTTLLVSKRLRIAQDLIGAEVHDKLIPQLIDELGRWRRRVEKINEGEDNESERITFTGKTSSKQDDLAVALLGSLYEAKVLIDNKDREFMDITRSQSITLR